MSGICGIYALDDRPVDRSDLEGMMNTLIHRGPDGSGIWAQRSVGLAHRMLRTTPESLHEELPLVDDKFKVVVLTADARIDNRRELISSLHMNNRPTGEITDSDLILAAYMHWGTRCPEELVGDFAFVIWDSKEQMLFCARDRLGAKAFYYYQSPTLFACASEIKALLSLSEVPRHLNESRIVDYLSTPLEDKVATFYRDIVRLPPGHSMVVRRSGVTLRCYWNLDPQRELRPQSDEEYADAFREIFTEAVRCRLRSAYPVGSLLSGGLDSSSIVCVADHLLKGNGGQRLQTFSLIFDDVPQCDERPFISAVLGKTEVEANYVHGDRTGPLADLDRILWHQDEPFYAPNLFLHCALYEAARQRGVRILFDGIDGDSTVSHGTSYLVELARSGRWVRLAADLAAVRRHTKRFPWKVISSRLVRPLAPQPVRRVWRRLTGSYGIHMGFAALLNPDFEHRVGGRQRFAAMEAWDAWRPRTIREEHFRQLAHGSISFKLQVAGRAAASFGVEPTYPFCDARLAEFCLALPGAQKVQRVVVRRAMTNILPPQVQWRGTKSNLTPNFVRSLLLFHRGLLDETILRPRSLECYVDMAGLGRLYERYLLEGRQTDLEFIWKAVTLALWLRRLQS